MKRVLASFITLTIFASPVHAATKSASPAPTKKATATSSSKPSGKALTKTSATSSTKVASKVRTKTTSKATSLPTTATKSNSKTTTKASSSTATKKPVVKRTYKPVPRKKVKLTPSPKPKWPPKGYAQNGDIYAKVPTKKELLGYSSSSKSVANQLETCKDFACGAVLAASQSGCVWWEFTADLIGPTSETDETTMKFGSVVSLFSSSKPKEIKAYILVSQEDIKIGHKVSNIKIACHRDPIPPDLKVPSQTYVK